MGDGLSVTSRLRLRVEAEGMLVGTAREGIARLLGERKLRVLTLPQIARTFLGYTKDPQRSTRGVLRDMSRKGLVTLQTAMMHPEIDVTTPLHEHWPGDDSPDFGRLSWQAVSRFQKPPTRTTTVTAGPKLIPPALQRNIRATELLHDTLLTAVFLNLLAKDSSVIDRWSHEDALSFTEHHDKVPDAVLQEETGGVLIECIGQYSAAKLHAFHTAFQHHRYRMH